MNSCLGSRLFARQAMNLSELPCAVHSVRMTLQLSDHMTCHYVRMASMFLFVLSLRENIHFAPRTARRVLCAVAAAAGARCKNFLCSLAKNASIYHLSTLLTFFCRCSPRASCCAGQKREKPRRRAPLKDFGVSREWIITLGLRRGLRYFSRASCIEQKKKNSHTREREKHEYLREREIISIYKS